MKKAAVFVCLLAGMAFAGDKSFTITLPQTTTVGGTELKAGDYKCELQDQKIVLKHGHDTAEAVVKIETGGRKNSMTSVTFGDAGGKHKVEEILVGGTTMKLVLN
jgi:hypothetical protein